MRINKFTLFGLLVLLPAIFLKAQDCLDDIPEAASQCTPPTSFDKDVVVTGNVTWNSLVGTDHQNITQKIRITGDGTITVVNGNVSLQTASAVLVIDGPEFIVNNGNFMLEAAGARTIIQNSTLRTFGNFQQTPKTFVCIRNCEVEIGDENANGTFNTHGNNFSSADFQNDGGYRYLEEVCINVTHDWQLQSTGNGTVTGGGLDVYINVCAEIGDAGANHATPTPFTVKDGDDSGNFQNSKVMKIFNSKFMLANGNIQTQADATTEICQVSFKTNDGSFQNSGILSGDSLCLGIDDQINQNDGNWTASVNKWYAGGITTGNIPIKPPIETSKNDIVACFTSCCDKSYDVEIAKMVDVTEAEQGDTVTFTIIVKNNYWLTTGVEVTDILPVGINYDGTSYTATKGTFNGTIWTIGAMQEDQVDTLTIATQVVDYGIIVNTATVHTDQIEIDTTNNEARTCFSVPVPLSCNGGTIDATAQDGFSSYQWYKDGVAIPSGTNQTYTITTAGHYKYAVDGNDVNDDCILQMCCDIIVIEEDCPCPTPVCLPIQVIKN